MKEMIPSRNHLRRIPVWIPGDQSVIYFVTVCCQNRQPVLISPTAVRIAIESLVKVAESTKWGVPQICLMPDHVHLLLTPMLEREQNLSRIIQRWKSSSQQRLRRAGFEGRIWQREFFDHLLRSEESLTEKWRYIEMNPVRAGLVRTPEEYPYLGSPTGILNRLQSRNDL